MVISFEKLTKVPSMSLFLTYPEITAIFSTCENTYGGFSCQCNDGFTESNGDCIDINECEGENECHVASDCTNLVGSYSCKCKDGFSGNGRDCQDVNECDRQAKKRNHFAKMTT